MRMLQFRGKMVFAILSIVSLVYVVNYTIFISKFRDNAYNEAKKMVASYVTHRATQVESELNLELGKVRALAHSYLNYHQLNEDQKWDYYTQSLKNLLSTSEHVLSYWSNFELHTHQTGYTKSHGRKILVAYLKDGKTQIVNTTKDTEGVDPNSYYEQTRRDKVETFKDPYWFSMSGEGKKSQLATTITVPCIQNGTFIGSAGVDLCMDHIHSLVADIKPFTSSRSYLIGYEGRYAYHPDSAKLSVHINDINPALVKKHDLITRMHEGQPFAIKDKNRLGKDVYFFIAPIKIGNTKTPWSLVVTTPVKDIYEKARLATRMLIIGALLGLILIGIFVFIITNKVVVLIKRMQRFSDVINAGDLTESLAIKRNDELGQLAGNLNQMKESIKTMVIQIKQNSTNISQTSSQLKSMANHVASESEQQAVIVEDTVSSIAEISASVTSTSTNSEDAKEIIQQSEKAIDTGNQSTQRATEAMENIVSKISIINDIALQTNILALNAGVEAARAGQAGKGFAVVAGEVKKLAELTNQAASEIVSLSNAGVSISTEAGAKFEMIIPEVKKTVEIIQSIAIASNEQRISTEHINSSIQSLNHITQTYAASSKQMASNADELAIQSEKLEDLIRQFKLS